MDFSNKNQYKNYNPESYEDFERELLEIDDQVDDVNQSLNK